VIITLTGSGIGIMLCAHEGAVTATSDHHNMTTAIHEGNECSPKTDSCMTYISAKLEPTLKWVPTHFDLSAAIITLLPQLAPTAEIAAVQPMQQQRFEQVHAPPRQYLSLLTTLLI